LMNEIKNWERNVMIFQTKFVTTFINTIEFPTVLFSSSS